jgi:5'-methylthioadenosine phosphorylase
MEPIGIIGGSGLYELEAFHGRQDVKVETPFGTPSDAYVTGTMAGQPVVFLPRHGKGHRLLPSEIPHRANIWGFKKLGVKWLISISAVGSLQAPYAPGHIVLPDQLFDRTKQSREHTFFGDGIVAHVSFGQPISLVMMEALHDTAISVGAKAHKGGTYVNIEGPAFSTKAESLSYRHAGYAVVGMTNLPEAKLCREAEIAYATMAMVTDFDSWHPDHDSVTTEMIVGWLKHNTELSQRVLLAALPRVAKLPETRAHSSLKDSILTAAAHWPAATFKKLELLIGKYR